MTERYWIDIETADGQLVTDPHVDDGADRTEIDVQAPFNEQATVTGEESEVVTAKESAEQYIAKMKKHIGIRAKRNLSNTILYVILVVMTIVWLLPFVGIVFDSFRTDTSGGRGGTFIPASWGFDNYINLFTNSEIKFGKWFLNTFIMGVVVSVVQTLFVLSMSYVLSRMRFKGRKGLMNLMLVLGMFPGFLTLILLYKLLSDFNMTGSNSVLGLILVYCASSGMGYYVSKGYFDTIPRSLDEAARVDGATRSQVMFRIILPMAKPIVIYTVLMGFMAPWGDFITAKYIAHSTSSGYNVATGLQSLVASDGQISKNYTTFCAGGVVVAIPIATLFMFLQKYYVAGVTGGAVKG